MAAALEPGRIIVGRYRVEEQLGEGGMGSVYRVRHVNTDEQLALKLLHTQVLRDETAVERFRREARAPARIQSEHVVRVTDADTVPELDNAPFLVMELLRGRDLERVAAEDGPIAPNLVVEYLRQAARALDKAHAMGIVHRDLKPENLFLTTREDGTPCIKLLDFGIARVSDRESGEGPAHLRTQAGYIFGTPMYMSPEQTMGSVDAIAPPTDVWAIGLCAFKLLVGQEFWTAQTTAQLCVQILSEPIPTPSARGAAFGARFDAWFARCVHREIGGRFQTAGEAVAALAEALGVRIARPSAVSSAMIPAATAIGGAPASLPHGAAFAQTSAVSASPTVAQGSMPSAPPFLAAGAATGSGPPPAMGSTPPPPARASRAGLVIGLVATAGVIGAIALGGAYVLAARAKAAEASGLVASASAPASAIPPASASATTSATPTATESAAANDSAEPAPRPSVAKAGARGGVVPPAATTTKETPAAPAAGGGSLSRDQRRRLDALQRMCDQGIFSAAECAAKRAAIQREN